MPHLDEAPAKSGVIAVASRKLAAYMAQDPQRREHLAAYFPGIVTFGLALLAGDRWMTEEEILAALPAGREAPQVMQLDDIERTMAYTEIAETDAPQGWSRYRWPKFDAETLAALSDFRFSSSYQADRQPRGWSEDREVRELFAPFPMQWGLRGDAFLWGKLAAFLGGFPLKAETDLASELRTAFRHLTKRDFAEAREDFHDPSLAHGGMSSGMVNMSWWREVGFPLLERRFERIRAALPTGDFYA